MTTWRDTGATWLFELFNEVIKFKANG